MTTTGTQTPSDIADHSLAPEGIKRIEWAAREMPVLALIRERFAREKPLRGHPHDGLPARDDRDGESRDHAAATAARICALCASNPLSTQDDVAAALVNEYGIPVFADLWRRQRHLLPAHPAGAGARPTADDGRRRRRRRGDPQGARATCWMALSAGTEETTTGVIRLKSMAADGALGYPIVAINESDTKHLFDNRYGTGQSTIDGIIRATNVLLAGKNFVVAGYGWCGRGVASRARGMGAQVIVTEVDPVKALEAVMDGFQVMPMADAAKEGDFFVTLTGDANVIDRAHLEVMKDGAIMANSGHFDSEINLKALTAMSEGKRRVRESVEEFKMQDGRKLFLLGEGRLVNLAAAEGHPAAVMDMSFANQALGAEWIATNHHKLEHKVYELPDDVDEEIARLKLHAMGIRIDYLTEEQKKYLTSWQEGT